MNEKIDVEAGRREADAPRSGGASRESHFPAKRYMVLDVETRRSAQEVGGWHKAGHMGVSVAVLYDSAADAFLAYSQEELTELFRLLEQAELVVGFNILGFDYAVLQPFTALTLRTLPTLDMLERVHRQLGRRVSLDNLAQATLGAAKSADGLAALRWWKQGRLEDIARYCREDVDITRRLYLHGRDAGHLFCTDKGGARVRVPVTWGECR